MSGKLNWDKARRAKLARELDFSRTRPASRFHWQPWRVYLTPRPPMAPPKGLGFRRFRKCWIASFNSQADAQRALELARAAGWHGAAKRVTASDRRSSGTRDRNATLATTSDRPA